MPKTRVSGLGSVGLNADLPPSQIPPNALTQALNVITEDGAVRSTIGERLVFEPANGVWGDRPLLDVRPQYHKTWVDASTNQWVIVSDGVDVYAYSIQGPGIGERITPTDDDTPAGTPVPWTNGRVTFAILNGVLVVNSASSGLFFWAGTGTVLVAAPGWNSSWRCRQIAAYRYQLVALAMTEGVNEYVHKIRWSTSAQEGAIPSVWDILLSNDAGDDILGETEGEIVGAVNVRDQLFIVKEDAVYGMRWIGGQYIHQVTRLEGGVGTRNPFGFCEMRGQLVVLSTSDILIFDGQNSRSLIDNRVRKAIFAALSETNWDAAQVFFNPFISRLQAAFPTSDASTHLGFSLEYNLEENTFSVYQLNNGFGFDLAFVSTVDGIPTWDTFGAAGQAHGAGGYGIGPRWLQTGTWDDQIDGSWNKGVSQPSTPDTLMYESNVEDTEWWLVVRNNSDTNSDGSPNNCQVGRRGLAFEDVAGKAQLNFVYLEMDGSIPVTFRFGAQDTLKGAVTWETDDTGTPIFHTINPGIDETIDPRVTGRFLTWEMISHDVGSWRLAGLTFEWEQAGER